MAVSLTTLLPPTRSGRTLFISSAVLGAFALLQMMMLCWHLLRSSTAQHLAPDGPSIRFAETTLPSTSSMDGPNYRNPSALVPAVPSAAASSFVPSAREAEPAPTPAPAPSIERPTPAVDDRTTVGSMIEQARQMRQNGDVTTALAELRQAQLADPSSPQVIAELGITYEAMQLPDRAFEQWQRLYNMGDGIGALYYLADEKLHSAPANTAPAPGTALPGITEPPQTDVSGAGRDAAGLQDTALLKITDIQPEEEEDDPAVEKKISLKIVVKNRPGTAINPRKVQIYTFFYDLVDGHDIVLTNAQTDHQWLTKPVTWADDRSQVLDTTYLRLKTVPTPTPAPAPAPEDSARGSKHGRKGKGHAAEAPAEPPPPAAPETRSYYGYTVRLYYDRQLQDVKADPVLLLQRFPPPLTLPEQ